MTPAWWHRDIFEGDSGSDVAVVARKLGSVGDLMNAELSARVRGLQRVQSLPISGVVDLLTAQALGESATHGLTPLWYGPPIDYEGLRHALRLSPWEDLEAGIRRFQSSHHHYPTGDVDGQLAIEIGD